MATATFQLKGVDKFMKELNREIRDLRGRTLKGMIKAVIELQKEAEPGTPVDLNNLRASWFTVSIAGQADTQIVVAEFTGDEASAMRSDHQRVISAAQSAVKDLSKVFQPVVLFGYTANYAVYVHENLDLNFQRPGAKARWLYSAMESARGKMLNAIAEEARF